MAYIPVVPHVPAPPPVSARARRLAGQIDETIDRFRRESPGTDAQEIRQALDLVRQSHRGALPARAAVAVGLGLLMAASLAGLVLMRGRPGGLGTLRDLGSPILVVSVLIGLVGLAAFAALLIRRR